MSRNPGIAPERCANIFVNYRREDSAGHAGRLFDRLSGRFPGRVFMDIDTLEPGVDFIEAIEHAVGSCEVLIVLIGQEWLSLKDAAGRRRLDDPADFVRLEVATALQRKIRVIPVLVQGASMPRPEDLPPDLAKLARRNAIELSDARWAYDVDRLIHTIEEVLKGVASSAPVPATVERKEPAPTVPAGRAARSRVWIALLAAAALAGAGWTGWRTVRQPGAKAVVLPAPAPPPASGNRQVAPKTVVPVPAPVPTPASAPTPERTERRVDSKNLAFPAPAPPPESEKRRVSSNPGENNRVETKKSGKHPVGTKNLTDSYSIPLDIIVSDPIPVSVPAPAPAPVPAPVEPSENSKPTKDPARQDASAPSRWKAKLGGLLGRHGQPAPAAQPVPPG